MIIMRQLREELTQALVAHLDERHRERVRDAVGWFPPFPDALSETRHYVRLENVARDCMDFMYGEIAELYPDQPSCSGQSAGSAPPQDPQG